MRIRLPFAGAFLFLSVTAAYAGLTSLQVDAFVNAQLLHSLTFFLLTSCFYWILDTSRRRTVHLTLVTCTLALGIGSEFLQGVLPNGQPFDFYDIVANVVGSLAALGLSSWYHVRMLERKRAKRAYAVVPGEVEDGDLELGDGVGGQVSGVVAGVGLGLSGAKTLDEEVDNWDENLEDGWDDDEHATGTDSAEGEGLKTPSSAGDLDMDGKAGAP